MEGGWLWLEVKSRFEAVKGHKKKDFPGTWSSQSIMKVNFSWRQRIFSNTAVRTSNLDLQAVYTSDIQLFLAGGW
jgi:hypothetical protein